MNLEDFALERFFARWEFNAEMLLCASDIEGVAMRDLLAVADDVDRRRWDELTLRYTESPGHPALREQIAGLYQHIGPHEVLVFSGAQEAIFALNNVLLGPDDHAIVVKPAYESLAQVALAAGAQVSRIQLRESEGWRVDTSAIRAALRPNTRLIFINEPHNPTGGLSDRDTFDELVAIAAEAGARLAVDEVYRFLEFDPANRLPAGADTAPNAVSIGVMSKAFGLAGLRIGWIATRDRQLLARLAAFKDYTTICASAPAELLAVIALKSRASLLERSRDIVLSNLALLDDFFGRWSGTFEWVRPRGGSIGFVRLDRGVDVDRFAEGLVHDTGVLIMPGSVFADPDDHFRIGFGRKNMPEALKRLEAYSLRTLR
jgi:aspartate/methionine/tyrosine aminotransferase